MMFNLVPNFSSQVFSPVLQWPRRRPIIPYSNVAHCCAHASPMDSLAALLSAGCTVDGVVSSSTNPFLSAISGVAERVGSTASADSAPPQGGVKYFTAGHSPAQFRAIPSAHSPAAALQRAWESSAAAPLPYEHSPSPQQQQQLRHFYSPGYSGYPAPHVYGRPPPRFAAPVQPAAIQRSSFAATAFATIPAAAAPTVVREPVAMRAAEAHSQPSSPIAESASAAEDLAAASLSASGGMPTADEIRRRVAVLDSLWQRVHDRGLDGLGASELEAMFDASAAQVDASAVPSGPPPSASVRAALGQGSGGIFFDHLAASAAAQYDVDLEGDDEHYFSSSLQLPHEDVATNNNASLSEEALNRRQLSAPAAASTAAAAEVSNISLVEESASVQSALEAAWRDMSAEIGGLGDFDDVFSSSSDLFSTGGSSASFAAAAADTATRTQLPASTLSASRVYSLGDPAANPFLMLQSSGESASTTLNSASTTTLHTAAPVVAATPLSTASSSSQSSSSSSSSSPLALIDELYSQALEAHARGDILHRAIPAFEAVLHLAPDHAEAWRMLGECHAEQEDDRGAIACFNNAVDADPYNRGALLSLGVSRVNEGQAGEAALALEAWLRSDPRFHAIDTRQLQPRSSSSSSDPYADGSSLDRVTRLLLLADAAVPGEPDLAEALGVLYNAAGDYDAAAGAFHAALRGLNRRAAAAAAAAASSASSQSATAAGNLDGGGASSMNSTGSSGAHATIFNLNTNSGGAHAARLMNRIGASLAHRGSHEDALATYAQALAARPSYARAWLNAGISHVGLGAHRSAVQAYLRALTLSPSAGHIWALLRQVFLLMDRVDLIGMTEARDPALFAFEFAS